MKKKIKYLLAILAGIIVITNLPSCSCGSGKSDKVDTLIVKPETEKIKGPLGDCFKVFNRVYKTTGNRLTIEVERTEGENEMVNEHMDNLTNDTRDAGKCFVGFTIEYLDADKNVVDTEKTLDDVASIIKNTRPGETGTVEFWIPWNSQIHSFRLASTCELNPEQEEVKDNDKADDTNYDEDLEKAEKALETGVKALEATNEALKVLNELQ